MDSSKVDALLAAAIDYSTLAGLDVLPLDGKKPGLAEWQLRCFTLDEIRACLLSASKPALGVKMGPRSGIIDFEADTAEQAAAIVQLLGEDEFNRCAAFDSRHFGHWLAKWDDRLAVTGKGNIYIPCAGHTDATPNKLIVRIGAPRLDGKGLKGSQSAFPPSPNKEWKKGRSIYEAAPATLTQATIDFLLAHAGAVAKLPVADSGEQEPASETTIRAAVEYMHHATKNIVDQNDGSRRKKAAICRGYEMGMSAADTIKAYRLYEADRPTPRQYDDANLEDEYSRCVGVVARFGEDDTFTVVADAEAAKEAKDDERYMVTPMASEAFANVIGKHVLETDSLTEANKHGRLIDLYAKTGIYFGRLGHTQPFAQRQFPALLMMLVGATGRGRKSESQALGNIVIGKVDPNFIAFNYYYQINSAEGLITALQDDPEKPGADKRRFMQGDEVSAFFVRACQEGSILSQICRQAFEQTPLQRMVGSADMRVTNYILGMSGAITDRELLKVLPPIEVYNGFANRFLWTISQREKRINVFRFSPAEMREYKETLDRSAEECATAIKDARHWLDSIQTAAFDDVNVNGVCFELTADALRMMADFQDAHEAYIEQSSYGELLTRGTNMVLRMALINAILHRSRDIGDRDVAAAIAAWLYCRESAERIFQDFTKPDTSHTELVAWIRTRGGSASLDDFKGAPRKYRTAKERETALKDLVRAGVGRWGEFESNPSGGKPFQRFILN
jgi:hypothetical protein